MGLCTKIALLIALVAIAGPLIYKYKDQREYNNRTTADEAANGIDLSGKVIIVTGSNTVCMIIINLMFSIIYILV